METINAQYAIQNLLNRKLLEYRLVNPSFSMRALAKKIGLQASATNEILKGQRRISKKVAQRIAENLLLDPSERAELLAAFPEKIKRKAQSVSDLNQLKINSMQFQAISEPVHYGILSLLKTKNFISDIDWMASRLDEPRNIVEKALTNLIQLDFVKVTESGEYRRSVGKINTTDDVLNLSIQKSHLKDIETAKEKLIDIDVSKRDFTSFTLPVDTSLLDKAKEIIRKAQDDIEALMSNGEATEVYKTCTYLYPITKLQ